MYWDSIVAHDHEVGSIHLIDQVEVQAVVKIRVRVRSIGVVDVARNRVKCSQLGPA